MTTLTTRATKGSVLTYSEGDANFKRIAQTKAGVYTVAESDNRDVIEVSAATTITLPDAAAIVNTATGSETGDFEVTIKNVSGGTVTITCTTGTDTIEGSTSDFTISDDDSITLKVNQAANGYNIISGGVTTTGTQTLTNKTSTDCTANTQSAGDNSTKLATTAYADALMTTATRQATSGAGSLNFGSIPSGTKKVTVTFLDTETSSPTDDLNITLGTSGGLVTSGYVTQVFGLKIDATVAFSTATASIRLTTGLASTNDCVGVVTMTHQGGNVWVIESKITEERTADVVHLGTAYVSLGAELTQFTVACIGGNNITGTNGYIGATYER